MRDVIVAGDPSLAAFGIAAVAKGWDMRMERVRFRTLGCSLEKRATEREKTLRLVRLARDFRAAAIYYGATSVWLEDLPTHGVYGVVGLAELRGVLRVEMEEAGIPVHFVQAPQARRLLYGRQPPRGLTQSQRKAWLLEPLRLAGLSLDDDAQADAFCVANYALSELGSPCLAHILGTPELKPKAKRMRKVAA